MDVTASNSILRDEETPESKCNTVSLLKAETQSLQSRNLLAVTVPYICYTVRKTLLRVIHTVSSQKALLRGHSSNVLDMKFCLSATASTICSVDDGNVENVGHVFMWHLDDSMELSHSILGQLALRALMVQPHPISPFAWAIASRHCIGVISSHMHATNQIRTYEDLRAHAMLESNERVEGKV